MAIAALFIGMTWLRTRLQYAGGGTGPLVLQPAGRIYFSCLIVSLICGWLMAPPIGRALWPQPGQTATLMRVVWFLATYFIFIPIHGLLRTRGVLLFRHANADDRPSND